MNKQFSISTSSIKTYIGSKSKRAGSYILWVKDPSDNQDALQLWKMFEEWLFTGKDNRSIIEWIEIYDKEKFAQDYDTLKRNAEWIVMNKGKQQVEVKWELFGVPCRWFIDNLTEDNVIEDIKTSQYLSKEWWAKNFWSGMDYREEYALQLRIYHMLTWFNKAKIIEVSKHKYVTKKDVDRHENQIIEFNFDDEYDKRMIEKYEPVVKEMKELWEKYNK